eukprot:Clim_evm139s210 gene=Clim_evmTU139s210
MSGTDKELVKAEVPEVVTADADASGAAAADVDLAKLTAPTPTAGLLGIDTPNITAQETPNIASAFESPMAGLNKILSGQGGQQTPVTQALVLLTDIQTHADKVFGSIQNGITENYPAETCRQDIDALMASLDALEVHLQDTKLGGLSKLHGGEDEGSASELQSTSAQQASAAHRQYMQLHDNIQQCLKVLRPVIDAEST